MSEEDHILIKNLYYFKGYGAKRPISEFPAKGAPAHRARATVEYLRQATPEFISPDLWPPNSPNLNPVDYKIWCCAQDACIRSPYMTWIS